MAVRVENLSVTDSPQNPWPNASKEVQAFKQLAFSSITDLARAAASEASLRKLLPPTREVEEVVQLWRTAVGILHTSR